MHNIYEAELAVDTDAASDAEVCSKAIATLDRIIIRRNPALASLNVVPRTAERLAADLATMFSGSTIYQHGEQFPSCPSGHMPEADSDGQ